MFAILANVTVVVPKELKRMMERVHGVNWSELARRAFEVTIKDREMQEASRMIDKLRMSSPSKGWSAAREVRKWRDRASKTRST